jgi:2,3-bisphosphoglycerate-dependent phosphoglycerate mutase
MEIYLVRHGQSTNNALENQRNRVMDPTLTELGKRQAEAVAKHLATGSNPELSVGSSEEDTHLHYRSGYGITHLYCSAMWRSLQTADPIARETGLPVEVWVDIHERGGIYLDHADGRGPVGYPGKTRTEILEAFPDYQLPDGITSSGWWNKPLEDSASADGRAIRVAGELLRIAREDDGRERVALVTHAGFAGALIKAVLRRLPEPIVYFHHYNTAITRIDLTPLGEVAVRYTNRVHHLPLDLLS